MTTPALDCLAALASRAAPACGNSTVIAIDGRAGSGKSTWGPLLAGRLRCPLVHMEHLYPGWQGLDAAVDVLREDVLVPLASGDRALVPQWDWSEGRWGVPQPLDWAPVVVVEGVGSAAARVAPFLSLVVWLECDEPTRRTRALGRDDGALFADEWEAWAEQERALLARDRTPERADLVIDTHGDSLTAARITRADTRA